MATETVAPEAPPVTKSLRPTPFSPTQGPFATKTPFSPVLGDEPEEEAEEQTPGEEPALSAEPAESAAGETAEPTESTEATEPKETAEPNADDALVSEAVERLGISAEAAKALGDNLVDVLASFDRATSGIFRESIKGEPEPEPVAKTPAPEPTPPKVEKFKLELDPDLYDEDQIKVFNTLQDKLNSQDEIIKAMAQLVISSQQGVEQITGQTQAEAESRYESLADGFFANLGDGFQDLFGAAPMRSLATNSPLRTSRNEVVEEAHVLKAVDMQKGRKPLTDEQYLQRALRTLHTDKLKSIARKEVLTDVDNRRKQAIHRPSSHNSSQLTARQRAEKFIADWQARTG